MGGLRAASPVWRSTSPARGRTYGVVAGTLGLIAVVPPVVGHTGSLGEFATNAAAYAATLGIPLWIALITLWSVNRYGRIVLTRGRLRVGRHELPVAALDPAAAREIALEKRSPLPPVVPGRIVRHMGGAWDTPIGLEPACWRWSTGPPSSWTSRTGPGL